MMLEAISLVFTELYSFNAGENGLLFLAQFIGPTVGLGVLSFLSMHADGP